MAQDYITSITEGNVTYKIKDTESRSIIGDIAALNTNNKNDIVSAINEVKQTGGSGGSGIISQPEAPEDTTKLWLDTDDNNGEGMAPVDKTLTVEGMAADAKTVGVKIANINTSIEGKLNKYGYTPNKFLGSDNSGNIVEKDISIDVPVNVLSVSDKVYTIQSNIYNLWPEMDTLDITLGEDKPGILNEFMVEFTSGASPTTLSMPSDIKWIGKYSIEPNKKYLISICNRIGVIYGVQL